MRDECSIEHFIKIISPNAHPCVIELAKALMVHKKEGGYIHQPRRFNRGMYEMWSEYKKLTTNE